MRDSSIYSAEYFAEYIGAFRHMEGEKILMAAGVTAAVVVGAFVFWGPSGSSRLRQRRGQIAGLHNFGRTCFLNTMLQALAACPQFIAWLQLHGAADKKSLIGSLLNTLEVINGTHATLRSDPYSPGAVLRALNVLGWVIPPDEHDAHELLHVLLASLEEESIRPKKIGCLSDALDGMMAAATMRNNCQMSSGDVRPSSAMLSDFCKSEYDEVTGLMRQARSEAHTPDSPQSVCTDPDAGGGSDGGIDGLNLSSSPSTSAEAAARRRSRSRRLTIGNGVGGGGGGGVMAAAASVGGGYLHHYQQHPHGDSLSRSQYGGGGGDDGTVTPQKRNSLSCRSLERLSRGPGRVSVWSEEAQIQVPHPFRGAQSSQMVCSACGYKSVVRYDKFDSITLPLPELRNPGLSLGHLLSEYIAAEQLSDVKCDSCGATCAHTKTLTFAKLPACLCIHISRTRWMPSGHATKRQDYVHFPESLSMAPYSFIQPGLSSQASTPWGSTVSLLTSSLPTAAGGRANGGQAAGGGKRDSFSSYTFGAMFPRNLYRLLAVVVHSGEANSGHFVTYRRGALRNSHKWYYTSDTIVREVTIDEVFSKAVYILFYDRGPQKHVG